MRFPVLFETSGQTLVSYRRPIFGAGALDLPRSAILTGLNGMFRYCVGPTLWGIGSVLSISYFCIVSDFVMPVPSNVAASSISDHRSSPWLPTRLTTARSVRWLFFLIAFAAATVMAGPAPGASGLPLPRFASLKGSPANVRVGPGIQYKVKWMYVKRGLPLEIYQEYGHWRRIRDWEGNSGWVFGPLLSSRRTGLAAPWSKTNIALRKRPNEQSRVVAWLEPKVTVELTGCDGEWCRVTGKSITGFIRQIQLWGVYPDERFER